MPIFMKQFEKMSYRHSIIWKITSNLSLLPSLLKLRICVWNFEEKLEQFSVYLYVLFEKQKSILTKQKTIIDFFNRFYCSKNEFLIRLKYFCIQTSQICFIHRLEKSNQSTAESEKIGSVSSGWFETKPETNILHTPQTDAWQVA